jgi:TolA-binding protein
MRILALLSAALLTAAPLVLAAAPFAFAAADARAPVTPEQRIERLEHQVRQVQKSVFPKGQPADTAGFTDAPAATQEAVTSLTGRLDAIERQMTDLVRTSEENAHRLGVMEADLARLRADNDSRFKAIEAGAGGTAIVPATSDAAPSRAPPTVTQAAVVAPVPIPSPVAVPRATPVDAGEAAYLAGFDLWSAKHYDQSIAQLRAMASSFPGHRRVSWANNLVGRALLDKGQPRAAAEVLLANYRGNPRGERASDSLFYLGQSLVKLGQTAQACKAYAELTDVYGATLRPQLAAMVPAARAQAGCK